MKTVALLLLGLIALSQAETETPFSFIEGFIRGLQEDPEDNSACRVAYTFIQTTGFSTLQNIMNAPTDMVEGIRALENIIRTMEYVVAGIENCNFDENIAQLQNVFAGPGLVTSLTLILNSLPDASAIFQTFLNAIFNSSWTQAGTGLGQIMKTYFNFSVESI